MTLTLADLERAQGKRPKRSKYGARKVVIDGITFDSSVEGKRYQELRLLRDTGEIMGLLVHPKYPLVVFGSPPGPDGTLVNTHLIATYEPDFEYTLRSIGSRFGITVTEDVKGMRSGAAWQLFRLKAKLFEALYGRPVEVWPPITKKPRKSLRDKK